MLNDHGIEILNKGVPVKVLSIVITLLLSFNLVAATPGAGRLSTLVDDFQFALTVEWDQKDKVAFETINEEFRQKLNLIVQEEGISKTELMKFLETKVRNKKLLDEMQLRIQLMSQNPTSSEIQSLFNDMKSSIYGQGASWVGEVAFVTGWVILAVIFIVYLVKTLKEDSMTCADKGGQEFTTQSNCGVRSVCVSSGENYCYEYQDQYKCDYTTDCVM